MDVYDDFYTVVRTVAFVRELNENQVLVKDLGSDIEYAILKTALQPMTTQKKRAREYSPAKTAPSSPNPSLSPSLAPPPPEPESPVIILEDGVSSVEIVPVVQVRPQPLVHNEITTDLPVKLYIKLQERNKEIIAGVATKNSFRMDTVIFFMSMDIIPKKYASDATVAVIRALEFIPNVNISMIYPDMLKNDFLRSFDRRSKLYNVTGVKKAPEELVVLGPDEQEAYSSAEQNKEIMYSRGMKSTLKLKQAKEVSKTSKTTSLLNHDNEVVVKQFMINTTTPPYKRIDLFAPESYLNMESTQVEVFSYNHLKKTHVLYMTTHVAVDPAWKITFLTLESSGNLELVGILVHHDLTRIISMIQGPIQSYTCANCRNAINSKIYACGHCEQIFYCGQECAKDHWTIHKEDAQITE